MRGAWIVVASWLAATGPAGAQELRGFLVLDGRPGYLTNPYLEPSFAVWDPSFESAFATGGVSGMLEWTGGRVSLRGDAGARALGRADSAAAWWSALVGAAVEWRATDRVRLGLDGSHAESERPGRRRTTWGRAFVRWDASSRLRLTVGPAFARTRLPDLASSEASGPPPLPIVGGPPAGSVPTAAARMVHARLEAWPGGRWKVETESFLVRTDAEDLGLEYTGAGGMLRLRRWWTGGASASLGLGGEGFGYRAALDDANGSGDVPEDDMIWRTELDARWPVGRSVDLVTRLAALHRSGPESGEIDVYGSVGLRLTLGGALTGRDDGGDLWSRSGEGMRIRIPYEGDGRLSLVGDFNGWALPGIPLGRESGAVHSATIPLEPGTYRYRIRVLEGEMESWLSLPEGAVTEDDGFGGRNGLLVVTRETRERR